MYDELFESVIEDQYRISAIQEALNDFNRTHNTYITGLGQNTSLEDASYSVFRFDGGKDGLEEFLSEMPFQGEMIHNERDGYTVKVDVSSAPQEKESLYTVAVDVLEQMKSETELHSKMYSFGAMTKDNVVSVYMNYVEPLSDELVQDLADRFDHFSDDVRSDNGKLSVWFR